MVDKKYWQNFRLPLGTTQYCLSGSKWSFDNSFLFVGSVATTGMIVIEKVLLDEIRYKKMFFLISIVVGYGNVTPTTPKGRLFCTLFPIFSIPFFAMMQNYMTGIHSENNKKIFFTIFLFKVPLKLPSVEKRIIYYSK